MRMLTRHTVQDIATWTLDARNTGNGAIALIDKGKSWTSFDIVAKLRGMLGVKKIGHAGTLDPLATGILIVCIGRPATKIIDQYQAHKKRYLATIKLGASTDSLDAETPENIFVPISSNVNKDSIALLLQQFIGDIQQVPPIYSALKKNGIPLYKLARRGEVTEILPRDITIHSIDFVSYHHPTLILDISCSKGTYIRSLARDIGIALGTVAYLSDLRRTEIGELSVEDAVDIAIIEQALTEHNLLAIPKVFSQQR